MLNNTIQTGSFKRHGNKVNQKGLFSPSYAERHGNFCIFSPVCCRHPAEITELEVLDTSASMWLCGELYGWGKTGNLYLDLINKTAL